jgi:hypothetical protein
MLDDKSAKYIMILTPFGKWHHVNINIFDTDWDKQIKMIDLVLTALKKMVSPSTL